MRLAARMLCLLLLPLVASGQYSQDTIFRDKDYLSPWSLYDSHGMHYAFLYKTGVRFGSNKAGPFELTGHWKGNVFFSADPKTKSDIETAKILDDGHLQIHGAIFSPDDAKDYVLHKVVPGHAPGGVAVAVQAPPPDTGPKLAWPPPKGTITIGMTREDLEKLPWHRDGLDQIRDGSRAETYVYQYHCDDPTLIDLTVTVKNGRVVSINGGNS